MNDTQSLLSPDLPEALISHIERLCVRTCRTDCSTGAVMWELTTGSLEGSYDSRLSVRVDREPVRTRNAFGKLVGVNYGPRLAVEGSAHKAIMGHNVYGGPLDPVQTGRYLVDQVAGRLGVELPDGREWTVRRADVAEVFDVGSADGVEEWFYGMRNVTFPRRNVRLYKGGLYSVGSEMTLKAYHKGAEFKKHDRPRLDRLDALPFDLHELYEHAQKLVRVEVEVRAKKLARDFGAPVKLAQLTREYLEGIWDTEAYRLMKEVDGQMDIVRTHLEVSRRLDECYTGELSRRLFGTWMQLAALGEEIVRTKMPKATWYWQRRKLIDVRVTWNAADVRIVPTLSALPADFSICRSSRYRIGEQSPEVTEALRRFVAA